MTGIELIEKASKVLMKDADLYKRYNSIISNFEQRKNQWNNNKIRIGVIGVTSSGKSTMINSILGDSILSMAVKPSSSQLVSCSQSEKKMATIYFENQHILKLEGNNLNENNLKKYSDENYNANNKKKVAQLELSTPKFELGSDVILIDSPGLDAYGLQNHEALTLEVLLPTIDVCIFVTTLKNNSDEKMKSVLNMIAKHKCQVMIVQNMLDSLRPSIDGKKSINDVALEHSNRVQRIINNSNIINKSNVNIVQISAINALNARANEKLTDVKKIKLLKKSNYNNFVYEVKEMLNRERPNIENQRLKSISESLIKIIKEAKEDISEKSELKEIKFEYDNLDIELSNKATEIEENLNRQIKSLNNKIFKSKIQIVETDISKLKVRVKECESEIIKNIANFNSYLVQVANKLHIPARDIVSINGLPSMPELKIKTKIKTESKIVKKSGFGAKISRFFGELFDQDWGYETKITTVTIIDDIETKKGMEDYLNRARKMYLKEIDSWMKKTRIPINQLIEQVNNRRSSFEERQKSVIEINKLKNVINELENLIANINVLNPIKSKKCKTRRPIINNDVKEVRFDKLPYNIIQIADRISNKININVNNILLENYKRIKKDWIIISWDIISISTFAQRFCGINFSQDVINILESGGCFEIYKYKFFYNPHKNTVQAFMKRSKSSNIYILTNATQYGSAQSQINNSGICRMLLKDDFLAFVVQDFIELINGNGVVESIQNMSLLTKSLNIYHKAIILINHSNPIYNLTIIEAQINQIKIQKEEIELLQSIRKSFKYLRNESIDNILSKLLRGISKKEKN